MGIKRVARLVAFVSFAGMLLAPVIMATLMLQDKPLLSGKLTMSAADIKRAKQLIAFHDPRGLRDGESKWLMIREADATLMANYMLQNSPLLRDKSWLRIETEPDRFTLEATVLLTASPLGRYLNIRIIFTDKGLIPELTSLQIGKLLVPRYIATSLLRYLLDGVRRRADVQLALQSIQDISMNRDTLVIKYQWNPELLEHARSVLVPKSDQQRLVYYQQFLSDHMTKSVTSRRVTLHQLIRPVFAQARERSSTQSAAAENRAAIIVLAAYVNGINLTSLVPEISKFPRLARRNVTLQGRHDLAQHFILSAALTATGGSALSNMVGLFKEIEDSRYGSGFNFSDLTADRAGTRFGDMATRSHEDGMKFQQRLLSLGSEKNLLPYITDLSRGMRDTEFRQRYGDTESKAYQSMVMEIDRRITELKFYSKN